MKQKVVAYCRVSTSSKDQENSFDNQKQYFEREVGRNEKMELVDIYADKGITGTSLTKRDEFRRMLNDAGLTEIKISNNRSIFEINRSITPKFDVILVKNTSRFARNVMVIDILRELLKNNVYVKFLDIDLLFDSSDKEFMLNLFLNFDQQDSIDKSKKVRFGHRESALKGKIFGVSNLYGYHYLPQTNELVINEEEASVIRKVYDLYLQGLGVRRIINILNEEQLFTRKNRPFSPSMLKRMISNEKYAGINARNKYDSGVVFNKKSYSVIRPEEEWIITEDRIPPIVTKEVFDQVQKLKKGKTSHITQKGIYKGISEYAGRIYCGNCGEVYTSNVDRGRKFYNCKTKKNKGTEFCSNPNISQILIEDTLQALQQGGYYELFVKDKQARIAVLKIEKEKLLASLNSQDFKKVEELKNKLHSLQEKKRKILDLYLEGVFEKEMLDSEGTKIDQEISIVQAQVKANSQTNESIILLANEIEEKIDSIQKLEVKKIYNKDEVLEMINKIIIRTNNENKPMIDIRFDGDDKYVPGIGETIEFSLKKYI